MKTDCRDYDIFCVCSCKTLNEMRARCKYFKESKYRSSCYYRRDGHGGCDYDSRNKNNPKSEPETQEELKHERAEAEIYV